MEREPLDQMWRAPEWVQGLRREVAQPMQLLEFITELARALHPNSVLDSWVVSPTILAAAHEGSGSARSCGLVRDEHLWTAAQHIAPLDWRLGDPLVLLSDLSHERFDFVFTAPPMGGRGSVVSEPDDPGRRFWLADLVLWRTARVVADHGSVLFYTSDHFFWAKPPRLLWKSSPNEGSILAPSFRWIPLF
jgi:hypothetical protein